MTLGSWPPLFLITCVAACASAEDGPPAAAVSFDRDVQPILRRRCAGCHNAEKPRGELDVTTYAAVVTGGATGKVALAHNPNESLLYTFASHIEEPYMPPNAPRIPQRELDLIRGWIEGGLVEKPGEAVHSSSGPAAGTTPGSPEGGLVSPTVTPRAFAITAVAVHPSDQTLAVSGHKQVILFDLSTRKLLARWHSRRETSSPSDFRAMVVRCSRPEASGPSRVKPYCLKLRDGLALKHWATSSTPFSPQI